MPTYDYECMHCGYKFEAFQKITEAPLKKCPKCAKKVNRLIGSGSGIIFKSRNEPASCPRAKQEGCHGCDH